MPDFRKRVLDVLKGEKPDRLPWFADLSWWVLAEKEKGTLDPRYRDSQGFVNLHKDLRTGLYLPLVWPYRQKIDCKCEKKTEGGLEIFEYHTPVGILREVHRLMPESHTWSYQERLMKNAEDLPALRYFIEAHQFEPVPEEADFLDDLYGSQGLPVVWVPRTPLSRLIVEMAGVEASVYALFEVPEKMSEIIELMQERDDQPYRSAAATRCDLVMIADNLSSEIQSPNLFRDYSLEYYQTRSRQLQDAGKIVLAHIDGTLSGLLPILNMSGIDCAEGVTPAPVGDVEPRNLRSVTGDNILIWGGIPGALFSPMHSEDEFTSYVNSYLDVAARDGRMIIGVGDQVPPGTDLERVRIVSDLCEARPL